MKSKRYTGVKDRNGERIHEGDRVRYNGHLTTVEENEGWRLEYGTGSYGLVAANTEFIELLKNEK